MSTWVQAKYVLAASRSRHKIQTDPRTWHKLAPFPLMIQCKQCKDTKKDGHNAPPVTLMPFFLFSLSVPTAM